MPTKLSWSHIAELMVSSDENNTVEIIACRQDNECVIKHCSDDRIMAKHMS